MPFTDAMNAELAKKLDPANVRPAAKFGPKGDYIEGWHAIAEANRIFGFDGWARETVHVERVSQYERPVGRDQKPGWSVTYIAKVRITAHGVVREGSGSGHGIGLDLGEAHESAIKEAETDAMKRALMTFGNPFGLALYDKDQLNVGIDPPELSAPAKVMLATIDSLTSRSDVSEWVFANREAAERLKDGAAVLAHARAHFKALPEELQEAAE